MESSFGKCLLTGGEFGNDTHIDVLLLIVFSIVSDEIHLNRIFLFLREFCCFRLEKLVLLIFRGYLGEIESEKAKP